MELQLKRPTPGNASPAPYGMSQLNSQVIGDGKFDLLHTAGMMSCKGVPGKSLTVEGDAVRFETTNVWDNKQRWTKKFEDPVRKDAFAIVNLATGKAIQIPAAAHAPVRLAPYNPGDTSLLWTDAEDTVLDGYSIIREFAITLPPIVGREKQVLHAVTNLGLQVVVSNSNGSDNQRWKFEQADKERKA